MKIGAKLIAGFLVVAFLVGLVGYFGIYSVNRIQKNNEIGAEITEHIELLHKLLMQVLQLIETDNLDDYHRIKTSIENIRKEFDLSYEKVKRNLQDLGIQTHQKDVDDFTKISNGVIAVHKEKLIQKREYEAKLVREKQLRHVNRDILFALNDAKLNREVGDWQYKSKEALFQYGDKKHVDEWIEAIRKVKGNPLVVQLPDLVNGFDLYERIAQDLGEVVIEQKEAADNESVRVEQLRQIIDRLQEERERVTNSIHSETESLAKNTSVILLMVIIIALVASTALGLYISHSISKALGHLSQTVQVITAGNLSGRAEVKSKDEIGQLARSFNKMVGSLAEANRGLVETTEGLKEMDKMKDEFLNITSHELKTPLIPIKSQLQLLLAGDFGKLTEEQKESLEMIYRNEERLGELISDLLDISRIKSRKLKLHPEKISLEKIIREIIGEMKSIAQKKKIDLLLKAIEMPKIVADPKRIHQVLYNLIDNAIKFALYPSAQKNVGFTPKKGKIIIEVKRIENEVLVKITDTGVGISSENIKKLFKSFFQVETGFVRKQSGTGLGLAICKGIIEAHQGKIWAESQGEGKGSTFSFTLPINLASNL